MNEIEQLKEQILAESERLSLDDSFSFSCHPGLDCFNVCCGDVNIFLTPYDVLRLKNRLGISSTEFIRRYTIKPFAKDQKLPVVVLKMDHQNENKPCFFVTDKGCSVYEDRPWPCRMYPIGAASARTEKDPHGPEFFFLMEEHPCDGFKEGKSWTIKEWIDNQGATPYNEIGELFKEVSLHPNLRGERTLNPQQMEMFFMACYDIDRFRAFVFESSFLEKYEVEEGEQEQMKTDDEALLRFSFRWLRTCLFNEDQIKLKSSAKEQYRKRLSQQGAKLNR